jgi:hypothetical protein
MALIDGEGIFGMGQGCDLHGDDRMRECNLCGIEFCTLCSPRSIMCPGCTSETAAAELEDDPDFEDAHNVDELLDFDDMTPPTRAPQSEGSGGS